VQKGWTEAARRQAAPSAMLSWSHQERVKEDREGAKGRSELTTLYSDESQSG